MLHPYRVKGEAQGPMWKWNGNIESPTFTPSLLVNPGDESSVCHLFITNGKIEFLGDCFHNLRGTTVGLVDIPEPEIWVD